MCGEVEPVTPRPETVGALGERLVRPGTDEGRAT